MRRIERNCHEPDPDYKRDQERTPGQKDRDRILYTSALRRLSGVTQTASAAEGSIYHNRLTHTLEVAQIGGGIANYLLSVNQKSDVEELGGLDAAVVEAAALAHDLGHPPFGHVAEEELNRKVERVTGGDGFEGNAQSFRIVTNLARCHKDFDGLNLTRASLNAILKYPWMWDGRPPEKPKKWGAYTTEGEYFKWVRKDSPQGSCVQSLEAAIMDWADDIAYAVHDMEDFYRAGLIPLEVLVRRGPKGEAERGRFVEGIIRRDEEAGRDRFKSQEEAKGVADRLLLQMGENEIDLRYDGRPATRRALRQHTANMIGRYITEGAVLGTLEKPLEIGPEMKREVSVLKELTWHYVINGPQLSTQQQGQKKIIQELFDSAYEAIRSKCWWVLPTGFQGVVEEACDVKAGCSDSKAARLAADFVSVLTEQEAILLHRRITGVDLGRLLGPM